MDFAVRFNGEMNGGNSEGRENRGFIVEMMETELASLCRNLMNFLFYFFFHMEIRVFILFLKKSVQSRLTRTFVLYLILFPK